MTTCLVLQPQLSWALSLCLVLTSVLPAQEPELPVPLPVPVEYQPYLVDVVVSSALATEATATLSTALRLQVERSAGPVWEVTWTRERPTPDSSSAAAMVYEVTLSRTGAQTVATVVASVPLLGERGPVTTLATSDVRELPARIVAEMLRQFRCQAVWEPDSHNSVRLSLQGAALITTASEIAIPRSPEILTPVIVYRDRKGNRERVTPIPWTYVVASETEQGRGVGQIVTGLRNPLSSRPRGRAELRAVAAHAVWPATTLELWSLSKPPRELVAHDVVIESGTLDPQEKTAAVSRRLSDRHGEVQLTTDTAVPWVTVSVLSGDQTLARVPIIPGAKPRLRLDVPDDLLRLRTEGQLKLLQGEMVAVVAERTALMIATRAAAKQGAWTDVDTYLADLQRLPTAEQFRERVSGIRVPAVATARDARDAAMERRIQRLCDDAEELIRRHLANDKLKLLLEEMGELRAAVEDKGK